ncbi:hypothetical protein ABZ614_11170 [Streptomyces sp. NPDC013178]|uniref:hypothetical protein n=1 Tax=Streptomyces sp. NPDC013178 TaxID=3155118 RepID=UPI0033C3F82A
MAEQEGKKPPQKKAAKRIAQLRRPSAAGSPLSNPALAGVKETVNRSYIGQGQRVPAPTTPDEAVPHPEVRSSEPTPADEPTASGTGENAEVAPVVAPPVQTPARPHAEEQSGAGEQPVERLSTPSTGTSTTETSAQAAEQPAPARRHGAEPAAGPQAIREDRTRDQDSGPRREGAQSSARSGMGRRLGAHEVLEKSYTESVIDLRLRKKEWAAHPFRFTPDLIVRLNTRAAEDSAATGLPLTSAQYVNAAMTMHLPASLEQQLELAEAFLRDMGARRIPEGQQSSYRVSPEVLEVVRPLSNHLKAAGKARTGYHIYSAVLSRFMTDLEAEGPLSFGS